MPSNPKLLGTPEFKNLVSGVPDLGLIQALPITSYGPWASDVTSLCLSSPSVRFSPQSHLDEKAVITTPGAGPGKVRAESKARAEAGTARQATSGCWAGPVCWVSQRDSCVLAPVLLCCPNDLCPSAGAPRGGAGAALARPPHPHPQAPPSLGSHLPH